MNFMIHYTRKPSGPNAQPSLLSNPRMQAADRNEARQNAWASASVLPDAYMIEIEDEDDGTSEFWVADGQGGWTSPDA